jgi:hypothetical protein
VPFLEGLQCDRPAGQRDARRLLCRGGIGHEGPNGTIGITHDP